MRSRKSFWILLCLLCLAGVWLFWHQASRAVSQKKIVVRPTMVTIRSASTAPKFLTKPLAASKAVKTGASVTNKFAYRLSNTSKSIGELVHDDKAILLENALIDLRNPLNFSIPKNLQSQGDPGAYIVQANGPIDNAFRAMLAAAGATIVSYIPNDAYLVRASASVANGIAADGFSVIPYEPYYKVQSSLLAFDEKTLPDGAALNLGLFGDDAPATIQQIEKLGGQVFAEDNSPFGKIVRVIPPQNWTALAQLSGVQLVEPFRKRALANDLARVTLGISTDTVTSTNYMNLTGKNVMVEMNDSGVDATHRDFSVTGSAASPGTVPPSRVIGDAPQSLVDTNGHGTHVAGIIAGNGSMSLSPTNVGSVAQGSVTNADFRGKAPAAKLFSVGGIEGDDTNLISDSYLQEQPALTNALISNNSWVYDGNNVYDLAAASYDAAVRDALPGVTGSQPVLFVFAAGNDGAGDDNGGSGIADSIQSPATAKDVITVGATEQLRNITNYVTASDGSSNQVWLPMTDSSSQVASYSSRGNVGVGIEGNAGRFKPDVVAPGTFVVSTRSGQWDTNAYFTPTNISEGELSDEVDPGSANFYSVSIPSNAVQLTIQVVRNSQSPDPLPAMPILVWNGTDPRVAAPYVTETNTVIIPTNAAALNPVGTIWQYAVSNSTSEAVNYDLIVDVITTNDLGDYFDVLYDLDKSLGPYYRYESGTSMAAPAVSGVLALMQDYFTNTLHTAPSPALFKAMIINGARQTANYSFQVQNSINFQGWGLANLPDSLPMGITNRLGVPCSMFIQDQSPTNALATGDRQTFFVAVTNAQAQFQPLRVTLAWTDPPGNPAAAIKLVNNLDLVVSNMDTGSTVYYGNDISSGIYNTPENPSSPPNLDSINNIENVYIPPLLGGHYAVTVIGNRVNVNAVTAQTTNSVGVFAPNVVQDYALVISSGDGQVTNAMTVTANPIVSNPTGDQQITDVTNSNAPLLNQFVGANTPLLGTNTLLFTNTTPQGFSGNWQDTLGMTNQWHFYVVTNSINNSPNFTNAAFITFEPPTLSIPREGVFEDSVDNATRPEADIDLYVATDPMLTNLNSTVISLCVTNGAQVGATVGGTFYAASLSRGGTEYVVDTNSHPGEIYYVGVKSEDQEASEYDFLPVFTTNNFSALEPNGDEIVNGVQLPINIPDGSPARPGVAYIIGLALYPIDVGSVVVTDQIWHQNFGDLIGPLKHNDISAVLNNHDSLGNTIGDPPFVYDDSGANDVAGSRPSDGPGSLNNFRGTEGVGPWILTEVDDSLTQTGSVQQFSLQIQPHQTDDDSHTNTVAGMGWFYDFVDVPPGATNLTITVTNLSPTANPPLELFIKYGALPTTNSFDEMVLITNVDTLGLDGSITISAPLTAGRYYYGVYNPSATLQTFISFATVGLGVAPAQADFSSSGPATILDDAVMTNSIFVSPGGIISSVDVGLAVNDPRISDLVFHLISPDGTRVLLMENRGGTSTNGAGGTSSIVTNVALVSDFDTAAAGDYSGGTVAGWNVTGSQVSVVTDPTTANGGGSSSNFLALANGTISTTLSTTPGAVYTLTFQYRGPGIAGWWRGENNNTSDSIGGNNATVVNTGFSGGEVGNAFSFTSQGQSVQIPDAPALNPTNGLSMDAWVRVTSYPILGSQGPGPTGVIVVGKDGYNLQRQYLITLQSGAGNQWNFSPWIGFMNFNGVTAVQTNTWYHVAMTYDNTTLRLYVNGNLDGSMTLPGPVPTTTDSFLIGGDGQPLYTLMGSVDEASLYNRALSDSEIKAIYTDGTAGKFDPAEFPVSLSLAEAQVSVNGITTNIFGTNTNWGSYTISFTANQSSTPLQIQGIEPGMLLDAPSVMSVVTNYNYLVFTENTNLTTTPIKFAVPPFVPGASDANSVVWQNGFEISGGPSIMPVTNQNYFGGGWLVYTNTVDVINGYNGAQADSGNDLLDLDGSSPGGISTNITTIAGQTYMLSFAYSRNPDGPTHGFPAPPSVQVLIGGNPLASFAVNLTNTWLLLDWQTTSYVFTASSPVTSLAFQSLDSPSDQFGVLLDTISLAAINTSDLYYLPEQSLDAFTGENAAGEWLLEIQDDRAGAGLTNTLESWQLRFNFTTSTSSLTNDESATNSLQPGGIAYYLVTVPTNADFATNFLFTTSGPLNFWFNETAPPSGTNSPGDHLLFNTSVNDSNVLSTIPSPTNIVPGGTYYLAVQNTNSFAVTNFAVEVDFHLLTVTNLIGGQPQTNTVAPGSFAYYAVSVPTNADIATNTLLFATGPVNLLFNQTTLPSGLGAGDFTLLSASTGGSTNLTLAGSPPLVPGATYYLGVQNTNNVPVNFGIEVNFHLFVLTNPPIIISSIIQTNIGGTNGFWLTWFAPSNDLFQVQWTGNLASPQVWNTFTNIVSYNTNVFTSPTNTQFNFFDDGSQFPFGPLRFYRLILLGSGLTNGAPQTNSIPPGGITYYSIDVPTNADFSTNSLFLTNGPLNLLFNRTVPPTGTNSGDHLLFSASANDFTVLSTNSTPTNFVPGGTYYLGVQNTNSFAVNYSIAVDFHLFTSPNPVSISSITYTNVGGTNDILLHWIAPANYQFQIQWVTNLAAPIAWNTISNVVITSPTTNYSYLDDGSLTGGFGPLKFYRLIEYPYSTPIPMALSIANAQYTASGIQFQWSAPTNYQYEIEWTTNLALPLSSWLILTNPVLSVTNDVFTFTDTNQTGPSTITKFFRLIAAP